MDDVHSIDCCYYVVYRVHAVINETVYFMTEALPLDYDFH